MSRFVRPSVIGGLAAAAILAASAAALAPHAAAESARVTVSRSAAVEIAVTATLVTSYPSGTVFTCEGHVAQKGIETYEETDVDIATRSGSTVRCAPLTAFLWPKADTGFSVQADFTLTATRPDGTTRTVARTLGSISLPLNNQTVTLTAQTRL